MKINALLIVTFIACSAAHAGELSLNECKSIGSDFRISTYLSVARELQQLGSNKAFAKLTEWAKGGTNEEQVLVLCRMLFEKKKGGVFTGPAIGQANFLGGTSDNQWPLEPIALHKGIPILIATGYDLDGRAELSTQYLDYCQKNCTWTLLKYAAIDTKPLQEGIVDFIKTTKWKKALSADEEAFLMKQAEPSAGGDWKPAPQP